jgi:benzoyl-CoA reductase/2-hydroxyglutaryl-CoA dehydratase subunit BcrC/BadD/HgdB
MLPANLCPLIKSTFGYHMDKSNPFLELADVIVAETTCDGKTKMFEIMGKTRETVTLSLPARMDDQAGFEYWLGEVRHFKQWLEKRFSKEITDEALRSAIQEMNLERQMRRSLAELMKLPNPPLTGRQLMNYRTIIAGMPEAMQQYQSALSYYCQKINAAANQVACGQRMITTERQKNQKPRVLLTGVPVLHGVEWIIELIENSGATVVCMENCTGLKPIIEDVDANHPDPVWAIARKYHHLPCSVRSNNHARLDLLQNLAKDYQVDCVIDLIWRTCLTYDVESIAVGQFVEDKLNLPCLRIETDYSQNDSARIAVRLGALFESLKGHC